MKLLLLYAHSKAHTFIQLEKDDCSCSTTVFIHMNTLLSLFRRKWLCVACHIVSCLLLFRISQNVCVFAMQEQFKKKHISLKEVLTLLNETKMVYNLC